MASEGTAITSKNQAIQWLRLNGEDLQKYYDSWANKYDEDVISSGYHAPRICAEALRRMLPDENALIIDCGAGTGIVGEELAKVGFKRVDAVDFSQKSLDISASKGVYERLICDKFAEGHKIAQIADGYYSGLLCIGSLSMNHISHAAFPEWNRVVKKGGVMVFTLRKVQYGDDLPDPDNIMGNAIDQFVHNGVWELVERTAIDYHSGHVADMFIVRLR